MEKSRERSSRCCGLALSRHGLVLHIGLTSLNLWNYEIMKATAQNVPSRAAVHDYDKTFMKGIPWSIK